MRVLAKDSVNKKSRVSKVIDIGYYDTTILTRVMRNNKDKNNGKSILYNL